MVGAQSTRACHNLVRHLTGVHRFQVEGGAPDRAEELNLLRDDDDFICRVLSFLPAELKQGYVSDESEDGKEPWD